MERMLLISAIDSNETGNRADRTGNSPISKFQTQHAYMPNQTTGKNARRAMLRKHKAGEFIEGAQPPSMRRESRGCAAAPPGGGHKDIPKKSKFPLGGEAPHNAPSTFQ